ncbi:MAG: presenilin family intramembrane aspartyl protease, partial [Methanothrix sp.]|nr:presenilin family intramembrane aspartyl protease [Methanothrix sp.]
MTDSSKIHVLVMLFFVIVVQILALAVTPAISASDSRVFQDPTSTSNPFIYMILILAFTALLLLAIKMNKGWIISGFIQLSIALSIYYLVVAFLPPLLALLPTVAVLLLIRYYPEWYVVDIFGIAVCAGISSLFGVSMTTLPALMLLIILAVYDAISVYKTKHMVSLAEGVIKMKAPLLFVVPKSRNYSFRKDQSVLTHET